MKKNLKYYMNLKYPIEIKELSKEEGVGYLVSIPLLGKYAFRADGETVEEALDNLAAVKEFLFKDYLEKGIPIPEPEDEEEKTYSGKFLLRVPVELHRFLAIEAKRNGTTLNQYCTYLLTRKSFLKGIQDDLEEVKNDIKDVFTWIQKNSYKMESSLDIYSHPEKKLYLYKDKEYGKTA